MTRRFAAGEDPAADDPDVARRARDSHSDSTWSSSCSSQSTLDEWSSTESGATASGGDSPSSSPDADPVARTIAEANTDAIEQLTGIVDELADRLDDQREIEAVLEDAATGEDDETANRGFQ